VPGTNSSPATDGRATDDMVPGTNSSWYPEHFPGSVGDP
jgi:hypothetical protein